MPKMALKAAGAAEGKLPLSLRCVQVYGVLNALAIARYVPKVWAVPTVALFLLALGRNRRFGAWAWSATWLWLGITATATHLLAVMLLEFGPTAAWYAYAYFRALPFVLFGLLMVHIRGGLIAVLVPFAVATAANTAYGTIVGLILQRESGVVAGRSYHGAEAEDQAALGIIGWGAAAALLYATVLMILAYRVTQPHDRRRRWLAASATITSIGVLLAGFATPVVLLAVATSILVAYELRRRRHLFAVLGLLFTGVVVGGAFSQLSLPGVETVLSTLIPVGEKLAAGQELESLDSSGRVNLGKVSWETFQGNPIIGVGSYYTSEENAGIGGHSSLLDWPAQFGLIGSVGPAILLIGALIVSAKLLRKRQTSTIGAVLSAFWTAYLVNCMANPTWLTPTVDFYAFMALGITAGMGIRFNEPNSAETDL